MKLWRDAKLVWMCDSCFGVYPDTEDAASFTIPVPVEGSNGHEFIEHPVDFCSWCWTASDGAPVARAVPKVAKHAPEPRRSIMDGRVVG